MATSVVTAPPAIPSKFDIIPIHGSDIASFKRCRRYWDWTSPTRNNLRRKVEIHGINFPLWFGTGIHYALEKYYDPILRHDPVESFKTWFQFQWEGGVVGAEWLDLLYDVHPHVADNCTCGIEPRGATKNGHKPDCPVVNHQYKVRGLKDMLPNVELVQDEVGTHLALGIGMMEFYKSYAERVDDFVVIAAESSFSIPLGFESFDIREESPNYNKKLEVHARGKRDAVIYYPEMDKFGIIDHKTAARINEDYFAKLDKDEQCSTYLWATIQESKLFDLPWKDGIVDRVVYNAVRKNYPKVPTFTSRGFPSLDRQKEGTTAELFKEAIVGNDNLEDWFRNDEKAQAYYTYLCEMGDSLFIQRDLVTRNLAEIYNTGSHIKMVARDMLNEPAIYPSPSGEFRCLQCAFRAPCISADDGSDWQGMLADGYEENSDR